MQKKDKNKEGDVIPAMSLADPQTATAGNSGLPGYAAFAASLKPPSLRSGGIGKPRAVTRHTDFGRLVGRGKKGQKFVALRL